MIIKTKEFKEAANKILLAAEVDKNAANLELVTKNNILYLNVTNREYYVSVKFPIESNEEMRAVVDASLFLTLISGITAETFTLEIKDTNVIVKVNKSKYKLAMIYENENLMTLPVIEISDKLVSMPISKDILDSILNINSKELLKAKKLDVNELQKLYYIDEAGCFTFTSGACLNSFQLDRPIKLLLNDRIVKLFKLFNEDVNFCLGYEETADNNLRAKISLETPNIYMAAITNCDDILLSKIQGPCNATKNFINEKYPYTLVLDVNTISAAISRLMLFSKNSIENINMASIPATIIINKNEISIIDSQENTEYLNIENDNLNEEPYKMRVNLFDFKLIFDSCKNEHVTLNCGNHRSIVISRGKISNLIPELGERA